MGSGCMPAAVIPRGGTPRRCARRPSPAPVPEGPAALAANGFGSLPVELAHVARVARLPFHHRDPFDRLLAAQALEEGLAVVSADAVFRRYGVRRVW